MSSGKKLSPPFLPRGIPSSKNLLERAPWALSHRRIETRGTETGGSTWYLVLNLLPKSICKGSHNHALRVENLSMQNWVEDTRSLDSPVAPDPCRQMHLGEQPGIMLFPKKSPSPLILGSHVISLQAVSLRNRQLKVSSAASSIIKCSTHRKGTDRSGIHQAGRHSIISLGSWMWLTWIRSLPGNDCDCQRRLLYDY